MRLDSAGGGIVLEGRAEVTGLYDELFDFLGSKGPDQLQHIPVGDQTIDPTDHAHAEVIDDIYSRVLPVSAGDFPVSWTEVAAIAHWLKQADDYFPLLAGMVAMLPLTSEA